MNGGKDFLGKQYRDLYKPYYQSHGGGLRKREISAAQTLAYMTPVLGDRMFNKLIDIGAGEGSVLSLLSERGIAREMFAVEVSESGIEAIKAKDIPLLREAQLFDGYSIPYPDKYFDLAITIHVLEHVEHERLLLKEISRVAQYFYIEVPLEHGFRVRRSIASGKKYGHINFYTTETLQSMLESAGMKVIDCKALAPSLEYEQHLYGPTKGRIKSFIRKLALAAAPKSAPWVFTYNGYAYGRCS